MSKVLPWIKVKIQNLVPEKNRKNMQSAAYEHPVFQGGDLEAWIISGIHGFKQWYQPINFGNGIHAHVTTPPNWEPKPELDDDYGLGRWNFIISKHLPDLKGLRVLDVGCNAGLFSLQMAKMGAAEVIGIDRDSGIPQKPDFLPRQNIVGQATFVRDALYFQSGEKLNVHYQPCDFSDYPNLLKLGKFDLIIALNVVYHELQGMRKILQTLGEMTNILVLQTALGHGSPIKEWATVHKHVEILLELGFTNLTIDAPSGYPQPIIVARK